MNIKELYLKQLIFYIGGLIGFFIIIISFKTIKNKLSKKDMLCNISIVFEAGKVDEQYKSLQDTYSWTNITLGEAFDISKQIKEIAIR